MSLNGGTAPVTYALAVGDGTNDRDNSRFLADSTTGNVTVVESPLAQGNYNFNILLTDANGKTGFGTETITVTAP